MRKNQPGKHLRPDIPETTQSTEQITTQIRSYKLLTPLFGGSPDPTVSDPISAIRATEVRGQLHFWWRACYGGKFATVEEMKTAEDQLWGKAHKKKEQGPAFHDTIQLCIVNPTGTPTPAFSYGKYPNETRWKESINPMLPPYAAFPLQAESVDLDSEKEPLSRTIFTDVTFTLTIQFPKSQEKEIEGALWAWETFGGIGGRTRRGFGALQVIQSEQSSTHHAPQNPQHVIEWIQTQCAKHHVSTKIAPGNTPCLAQIADATKKATVLQSNGKTILGVIYANEANAVWKDLIEKLKAFRQPKKSLWPETKAVKDLIKQGIETTEELDTSTYHFPKAALGLPMNFHHKQTSTKLTLQGPDKGRERFASPLILRPLCCLNNQCVGLALVLTNRELPAQQLMLLGKSTNNKDDFEIGLVSADVPTPAPPHDGELMPYLLNEKDVALAFMKKYFRS